MKVEEIHAIAPLADVYELRSDAKYIVIAERRSVSSEAFEAVGDTMAANGLAGGLVFIENISGIKFFEFGATKE